MTESNRDQPILRTVVIGAGAGIFATHRRSLVAPHYKVVGVADVNTAGAEAEGRHLGCPAFTDHTRLLADVPADLAVIVTPHPFHAPIAQACFDAGLHVLVEKPISVEVAEADAMVEAAQQAGKLLAVSFQQRFRPDVMAAARLLREGALGQMQHMEMTVVWPRTQRYFRTATWRGTWNGEGGGVLLNQAPHNLDLICHLMGMPSQVMAWTRTTLHPIETEDTVQAMFEWPNGALGSLHVSTAESGQPERLEILGTAGRLALSGGAIQFERFNQDLRDFFRESDAIYNGPDQEEAPVTLEPSLGNHAAIYANLYDAIVTGAPLMVDGASARMSLELANAMILSSHRNAPVTLPLDRHAYSSLLADYRAAARGRATAATEG